MAETHQLTDYGQMTILVDESKKFDCDLIALHRDMYEIRDKVVEKFKAENKEAMMWDVYQAIIEFIEFAYKVNLTLSQAASLWESVPQLVQKKSLDLRKSFSTSAS